MNQSVAIQDIITAEEDLEGEPFAEVSIKGQSSVL